MKVWNRGLKVLSLVALLAPGLSFAEGTDHAAAHEATAAKTEEVKAHESAVHSDAAAVKPAVVAEEKTDTKSFCGKTQVDATKKCNQWVKGQQNHHKGKFVGSTCSEPTAATKADKCKGHVSHGEVKFHH